MEETEKNIEEEKEISSGVYEVGYLIVPTVAEENLGAEVAELKDFLTASGAVFISEDFTRMIELAYEMSRSINNKKQKFSYGYFGWVKFECSASQAKEIKEALDKNEKIIRYLFIKTVRESTMSPKRSFNRQEMNRKRVVNKEEVVPEKIDEEVIDKEIEALVAE